MQEPQPGGEGGGKALGHEEVVRRVRVRTAMSDPGSVGPNVQYQRVVRRSVRFVALIIFLFF